MSTALEFRYKLARDAFVLDVDFAIPAQGLTGVFGRSGAGKTSLLRCIAGLESSLAGLPDADTRPLHKRRIGYVFQEPRLFGHLTVQANLDYGRRRAGGRSAALDTEQIINMLALQELLPRRPAELSGGEAQRVAIGRALFSAPELVLMDEPLSGLDEERKAGILPFLETLHTRLALPIIYVSHSIDEICRLCDTLIVLEQGRIVANGDLQAVLTDMAVPVLSGREAGSVIDARIHSIDETFELASIEFSGGRLLVPDISGQPGQAVRLRIRASDISLCRKHPQETTILNVLPATVDAIHPHTGATVLVRLRLQNDILLARITRKSLAALALAVGDDILAQIKSVTVRC